VMYGYSGLSHFGNCSSRCRIGQRAAYPPQKAGFRRMRMLPLPGELW